MDIKSNAFKVFVNERCEEILSCSTDYRDQSKKCLDLISMLEKTLTNDEKTLLYDLLSESNILESIVRSNIYIQSTIDKAQFHEGNMI